jgi:Concanavalin A-like lectin/glucanases superfamily
MQIPWTTRPPYGTPLDPFCDLAQGLIMCVPCNEGAYLCTGASTSASCYDLVTGALGAIYSPNLTWTNSIYGVVPQATSNGNGIGPYPATYSNQSITFGAIWSPGTTSNYCMIISSFPTGKDYELRTNNSGKPDLDWNGVIDATGSNSITAGLWYAMVGVANASNIYVYLNGALAGSHANSISQTNITGIYILGRNNPSYGVNNQLALACAWNRPLSAMEVMDWSNNPWQIFQPSSWSYQPSAGGPYTYSASGLAISGAFGGQAASITAPLGGLTISGYSGAQNINITAPLGGLAISGAFGGQAASIIASLGALAISGALGGISLNLGGSYTFSAAGLQISGACGGTTELVSFSAAGLAISGSPGAIKAGPSPGVAGILISGGPGGTGLSYGYTFSAAGLHISGGWGTFTIGAGTSGLYLPYDLSAVLLVGASYDSDPFGIDPEQTIILTGPGSIATKTKRELENILASRLVEDGTYRLLESSATGTLDDDPFNIDPEKTTLIIKGLISSN